MSALLGAGGDLGQEHPAEIWVQFFEHITQYERLYRALLGSKGSPWFVRKMRADLALLMRNGAVGHTLAYPSMKRWNVFGLDPCELCHTGSLLSRELASRRANQGRWFRCDESSSYLPSMDGIF
jgi:hypothetical protein